MPVDVALARALELVEPLERKRDAAARRRDGPHSGSEPFTPLCPCRPSTTPRWTATRCAWRILSGIGGWHAACRRHHARGRRALRVTRGAACRILTGAAVPRGADAVVAQEDVAVMAAHRHAEDRPKPGQHIRRAGDDLAAGAEIVPAGRLIGTREAGAIAAAGAGEVKVSRRLRVAVLSTGSELIAPGNTLEPGRYGMPTEPCLPRRWRGRGSSAPTSAEFLTIPSASAPR
jgi:molybdopterin molybdotransferase